MLKMCTFTISGVLLLFSACSDHRHTFTEGPLRLQARCAVTATVGEPWKLSVMIAGVLPPAGAYSRWEISVDNEIIQLTEGIFFPQKRIYDAYITFNASYWYEKTTSIEVPQGGQLAQGQLEELMSQLDDNIANAHVLVRLYFYDSEKESWKVYASVARTVNVHCPQCPPVTSPRGR